MHATMSSTNRIVLPHSSSCISCYSGDKHQHSYLYRQENRQVAFFSRDYCPARPSVRVKVECSKYCHPVNLLREYTNEKTYVLNVV